MMNLKCQLWRVLFLHGSATHLSDMRITFVLLRRSCPDNSTNTAVFGLQCLFKRKSFVLIDFKSLNFFLVNYVNF